MSRMDAAASHAMSIDGMKLGTMAQILEQSMSCGSSGEHRLSRRRSKDKPMKFNLIFLAAIAAAQTPDTERSTLALSPALIMVHCKPGQSTTQTLTIVNHTASDLKFNLATEDVVVRDGKRVFLPAGQIADGIALTTVAAPAAVMVKAGDEASVQVTLTLPPATEQRAVITFFRSVATPSAKGSVGFSASLGTLITFNLTSDTNVKIGPVAASLQTPAANMILSEELGNTGYEPILPKGVVVILNESGKRVAKATFNIQRLLPGERLIFAATNPAQLPPGHYRALSSFEFEQKIVTSASEFTVR